MYLLSSATVGEKVLSRLRKFEIGISCCSTAYRREDYHRPIVAMFCFPYKWAWFFAIFALMVFITGLSLPLQGFRPIITCLIFYSIYCYLRNV